MKCFLLLIALVSFGAFSTSIRVQNDESFKSPTDSKTIVLGTLVEDADGYQFLVIERAWTSHPRKKIYIPTEIDEFNSVFRKRGFKGGKYLFFSINETDSNGVLSQGVFLLKQLNGERILIDKLALKKDFVGEINPSWQFCEFDNECIQAKNNCGNLIAVNKKYKKEYLDFLKTKKGKVDCSETGKANVIVSKCVENFCN